MPSLWYLEVSKAPADLDRAQSLATSSSPGDAVKFAGKPVARRGRHMYVTNVLAAGPDGDRAARERAARWQPNHYLATTQATIDPARAAADRGEGIFRVWVASAPEDADWAADPPLTDARACEWQAFRSGCVTIRFSTAGRPVMPAGHHAQRPLWYSLRARAAANVVLKNRVCEIDPREST